MSPDEQLSAERRRAIPSLQLDLACVLEARFLGPPEPGCLHPTAALRFLIGGNATFTLLNLATRARCTLRVQRPGKKVRINGHPAWSVEEQTGQDNVRDLTLIAAFDDWTLHRLRAESRGWVAIEWLARKLWSPGFTHWPSSMRFMHAGRCCRCGRTLTVPESIATGIGPECARRRDSLTKPGDPLHGLI